MGKKRKLLFWIICSFLSYFAMKIWFPEDDGDNPNDDLRALAGEDPMKPETYARGGGTMDTIDKVYKYVSKDRALKVALFVLLGGAGVTELIEMFRKQIINASPILLSLPGFDRSLRLRELVKTLPTGGVKSIMKQIYAIVNDTTLTNEEKVYLLKKIIKAAFVSLSGLNKRVFLLFLGYVLIFLLTNNTPVFALLVGQLRELIKGVRTDDGILDFIIETYKEYNAPFPEELVTQIKNTIKHGK